MAALLPIPRDSEFNGLLVDVCMSLTGEDYRNLRLLVSGPNGLSSDELRGIASSQQIFEKLKDKQFLHQNNILYLQCLLWRIDRKDLFQKVCDFARAFNETVYLDSMVNPPNGYRFVGVHLKIPDSPRLTQDELRQLISNIAGMTGIPSEEVKVAGVQESGSVTVKLILPEEVLPELRKAIKLYPHAFAKLTIDFFVLDGEKIEVGSHQETSRFTVQVVEQSSVVLERNEEAFVSRMIKRMTPNATQRTVP